MTSTVLSVTGKIACMQSGAAVEKKHVIRSGCLKRNKVEGHLLHKVLVGAGETRKEIEHLHSSSGVSTSV